MNHILAKKLRDNGFPQEGNSNLWFDDKGEEYGDIQIHPDHVYSPLLEELIAWCGIDGFALFGPNKGFHALREIPSGVFIHQQEKSVIKNWKAVMRDAELVCDGATPKEAVARLGIELHACKCGLPKGHDFDHIDKGDIRTECSDPNLEGDCSGCTDLRGDPLGGTHQGCTKQHGHIGCNLST